MKSISIIILSVFSMMTFVSCASTGSATIDKEQVRQSVKSQAKDFGKCYNKELDKNGTLEGKVVLAWNITDVGTAQDFKVDDRTTLKNENVQECIISLLKNTKFPQAPKGKVAEIVYPFIFTPDSSAVK